MSNPTTPFNWQMPTNTDLVTDLPADFEVFGQAVATSMADLLGGTTGQILSKATNADMDFTWINNDQGDITGITATSPLTGGGTSGAITVGIQASSTTQSGAVQLTDSTSSTSTTTAATPNSVKTAFDTATTANTTANAAVPKSTVTTAGDVIYATGSSVVTRLGIGTAGQVLTVNGGATAPSWATPASTGGMTLLASGSMSGSQVSITGLSGSYETLVCYVISPTNSNAENFCIRLNNDTGSNYGYTGTSSARTTTVQSTGATSFINDFPVNVASGATQGWQITIQNYTAGNYKTIATTGAGVNTGTKYVSNIVGMWASTSAVTEIDLFPLAGNWSGGTYEVFGVK
jgi:hypothetical protein